MKLVFYDGQIDYYTLSYSGITKKPELKSLPDNTIDGKWGISANLQMFKDIYNKEKEQGVEQLIITNSVELLNYINFKDVYLMIDNPEGDVPFGNNPAFIIKTLQECCDKEIRDCHDIRKLYLSGAFGDVYQLSNKKEGI